MDRWGWGIENPDAISSILGRIAAVGITITGAAFCAKQYTRQKSIAEDYAYKATLSKSIVAFAEEISISDKEKGGEYVGLYLRQVLDEIHKDPQRLRNNKKAKQVDRISEFMETVTKLVPKEK